MPYLNSSVCISELLETKLRYEPCIKNVSNTIKNRYKGNLTMKIDHFFTGGRRLNIMPEALPKSYKKKLVRNLVHFLRRKNH
jgi:hypothetical protein